MKRLISIVSVLVFLLLSIMGCNDERCADGIYVETMNEEQNEMASLINDARADAGVPPLTDTILRLVAIDHSQDMACRDFFDHINPDGENPSDRVQNGLPESYPPPYRWISENIGNSPTASAQFEAWMSSEGHRDNILDSRVDDFGIGLVYKSSGSSYTHYWTVLFIGRF